MLSSLYFTLSLFSQINERLLRNCYEIQRLLRDTDHSSRNCTEAFADRVQRKEARGGNCLLCSKYSDAKDEIGRVDGALLCYFPVVFRACVLADIILRMLVYAKSSYARRLARFSPIG